MLRSRAGLLALPLLAAAGGAAADFRQLRHEDDFIAQRQMCADDNRIACWKARPVAGGMHLSLGGDLRWRYEYADNPGHGEDPQDHWGAWLQRHSLFADVRLGEHWRGFAQLGTSLANGRAGGPAPVDENRLDPMNLFVELRGATAGDREFGLRAGIQEMRFGSARLMDVRDGTNVRRSFDAIRTYVEGADWRIDAFAATPRLNRQGSFDDGHSDVQALRGIYAVRTGVDRVWDVYLLHYEDLTAHYVQGDAHERRWTLGLRVSGTQGGWDWNWESAMQGGRFGSASIRAWTVATETGYRFTNATWQPRLALLAAVASGDRNPDDNRLGTFNPMYPRGNYFGEEATLGPRNFFNVQPTIFLHPTPRLELNASLDLFWRHSTNDGAYAPNGTLIRTPGDSSNRHVATIASFGTTWTPSPGWTTGAVLAWSRPGSFLRDNGPHEPLRYLELTLQHQF
ncbi:alginate export family protein [Lysobacter sp. A289]